MRIEPARKEAGRRQVVQGEMQRDKTDENGIDRDEMYSRQAGRDEAEKSEAESGLAVRVLEACRNQLFFRQRFLEQALFRLEWVETEGISLGSDGRYLYYNRKYILKRYAQFPGQMSLDYLHTIMHCLYQHPFSCPVDCAEEQEMNWNLAADIAVECVLEEMGEAENQEKVMGQRSEMIRKLKDEIGHMSAQKIFSCLQKNAVQEEPGSIFGMDFHSLCELVKRDEHGLWYGGRSTGKSSIGESEGNESSQRIAEAEMPRTEEGKEIGWEEMPEGFRQRERQEGFGQKEQREDFGRKEQENLDGRRYDPEYRSGDNGHIKTGEVSDYSAWTKAHNREELQQIWRNVADRVLVEAQASAHSGRREIAGSMLQHLKKLTRETYDYTRFLMKFATHWEERMQIDEDEFDYAFYTYGMKLFGKFPLIEPLEYKEKNLIREFLIAIDTSGSCQGEVVECFLTKTYNILRQTQAFSAKVNIHIVQCDARIQEDTKIESQKELETYIAHLTLKGFGGTDFTPVFRYADRLLETGEISRLDGLLYFTDGYGTFPARPPSYKTAFVFLDRAEEVKVPPWAIKVYLDHSC